MLAFGYASLRLFAHKKHNIEGCSMLCACSTRQNCPPSWPCGLGKALLQICSWLGQCTRSLAGLCCMMDHYYCCYYY